MAEDLYHDPAHPAVQELSVQRQTGYYDAEDALRGQAGRGDARAKAVIAEVDAGRAARAAARQKLNVAMCAALGLTPDQLRAVVGKLAADRSLWSWFGSRVNRTAAYQQPLANDD